MQEVLPRPMSDMTSDDATCATRRILGKFQIKKRGHTCTARLHRHSGVVLSTFFLAVESGSDSMTRTF